MEQSNAEMKQMLIQDVEDVGHYEMQRILRIIETEVEERLNAADREERMTIASMGLYNFIDEWVKDSLDKVVANWNDKYRYSASVFVQRTKENEDKYKIGLTLDMDFFMGMHEFEKRLWESRIKTNIVFDEDAAEDVASYRERPSIVSATDELVSRIERDGPLRMHRSSHQRVAVDPGHGSRTRERYPERSITHVRAPEVPPRENIHRRNLERYRESMRLPQDASTREFRRILEGRL